MNHITIATTVLIFTSLFGRGLNTSNTDNLWQAQAENVVFQSQETAGVNLPEYEDQGLIGVEGGVVYIKNDNGERTASVTLNPGFLKEPVLVSTEVENIVDENNYDNIKRSPTEILTPVMAKD